MARWSEIFLKTVFAVETRGFFDKTNILKRSSTVLVHANEMIRAPDFSKGCNEWAPANPKKKKIPETPLNRYFYKII